MPFDLKRTLRYVIGSLFVLATGYASSFTDFEINAVSPAVVEIRVDSRTNGKTSLGIAITESTILTTSDAVSSLLPADIFVNDKKATIARIFKDEKLALLSTPGLLLQPVRFSRQLPDGNRQVNLISRINPKAKNIASTVVSIISISTKAPGYFDISLSPSLVEHDGAPVFNNCGELIGLYHTKVSKKISTIKNLDVIRSVASSIGQLDISSTICPSEAEKADIRAIETNEEIEQQRIDQEEKLSQIRDEAEEKQKAAQKALEDTEARLKQRESEVLKAKKESEIAIEEFKQEALENQRIAEEALALARQESENTQLELAKTAEEADLALESAKKATEAVKDKAESDKQKSLAKQNRERIIVGGLAIALLLLLAIIWLLWSRKSNKAASTEGEAQNSNNRDILLRGPGISMKIPEEAISRESGIILGRSASEADYVIDAPQVSRAHMQIIKESGFLYALDLGSANGSAINEYNLEPGKKAAIHDGDTLRLADAVFSVEIRER